MHYWGAIILDYIYIAVFTSFPEALLILLLGFNLSNYKNYSMSKVLIVALIQSTIALCIKLLNVHMGVHTIIQIVSLYLLVLTFFNIEFYKAIIPVLIGSLTQGVVQSIVILVINTLYHPQLINLYNNSQEVILFFVPVLIISLLLLNIIRRKKIFLCDISS